MGSDIVSIHSRDENEVVSNLIVKRDVTLFIGMHQKLVDTSTSSSLTCTWSDQTQCDFGDYNNETDPARQKYPWLPHPVTTDSQGSKSFNLEL